MNSCLWPTARSEIIVQDRTEGYTVSKKYEFIEHTADLGFKAYGASRERLFAHAAEAFFEAIVALESVEERLEIYLYDTDRLVFKSFQIKRIEDNQLEANVRGEVLDPERHEIKTGVKAVTYHQLYVKERVGGWEARVIFDI